MNASELMNGSFQPSRCGTMIRWPDEEIGRNSVRPCTIPMTSAWMMGSMGRLRRPVAGRRAARRDLLG